MLEIKGTGHGWRFWEEGPAAPMTASWAFRVVFGWNGYRVEAFRGAGPLDGGFGKNVWVPVLMVERGSTLGTFTAWLASGADRPIEYPELKDRIV